MNQGSRKKLFGGFSILAGIMALAASSHAQPKPVASAGQGVVPAAQSKALPGASLKLQPIVVSPDLKQAIARKAKFDPGQLAQRISYSGNTPVLKIKNGKSFQLQPLTEPPPPPTLQTKTLPQVVSPYKVHIESPFVIGKRVIKLPDLVISNMAQQTPVKDQGARGTCTAFAALGGLEARGKREGVTRDLSENHAFQLFMSESGQSCTVSGGFTTWQTGPILTERGVCAESFMPYTSNACPSSVPVSCQSSGNARFTSTAHFFTPTYGGTGALRADNTNLLESFIKAGHDIVYGLNVAGNDWSGGDGIIDVQVDGSGNPAPSVGGHAMLIVGYNRTQNYFIVKNSWGTDWGHDGYAHISYEYIQTYGKYGYAVLNATVP